MMEFTNKPLDEWLIGDWIDAMHHLDRDKFIKRRRLAERAGIDVPGLCYRNTKPRITFRFAGDNERFRYWRIQDNDRLTKFNNDVIAWSKKVENELKINAPRQAMNPPRSLKEKSRKTSKYMNSLFTPGSDIYGQSLAESITSIVRFDPKYNAEAINVGFNFARHGIYLHYGAGKGEGGFTGSKWTDRYGRLKTTDENSKGYLGTIRQPIDWFNPVLRKNIKELADIAVDYCADVTVNVSRLYLPI